MKNQVSPELPPPPVTPDWFSLKGRCSRGRFVITYFPVMFILWVIKNVLMMMWYPPGSWAADNEIPLFDLLSFLASVLLLGPVVIRRMHDVGFSAAFYLAGAGGRTITLALPLFYIIQPPPNQILLTLITISSVWGWLCTLIYLAICLLPSQSGSNDYGPSL